MQILPVKSLQKGKGILTESSWNVIYEFHIKAYSKMTFQFIIIQVGEKLDSCISSLCFQALEILARDWTLWTITGR